jgi:predicted ATPase/class 3 adenylate cyclase
MNCPSCTASNPDGKKFCGECGSPLPRSCPSCGSGNPASNRFCGDCGAPLGGDKSVSGREPMPQARAEAERRQLTVLFCDLVGSTELSAKLDPEDMREVIRAYQQCCAEVVKRWDGHIANYMGDGVLVLFGYPQAHEDDAERAVRAGLEMTASVARLTTGDSLLAARVGIATGQVVVGELFGEDSQEQPVAGETPNLAARLQTLAQPGTVVIAARTRRLLGGLFELADLGPTRLKGFAEPLAAFRVVGKGRAEGRFEALRGQGLVELVGREHEIGLLVDRWLRAKEGEGQVILLSGEPGIGKSRIVRALRERVAGEPHSTLSHYCSPHHTNSTLAPVIGLLERAAGFADDDGTDVKLDKLEVLLAKGTDALSVAVPLVGALLEIDTSDRYPAPTLSPQRQKQRTLEVLVEQVEGLAARQPVLAVYEDVQWIDPTTLETLDMLVERVQRLPVLVLITFRPEFSPPWTGHAHVMQLSLSRLTRRDGQAIVEQVTGGKVLPKEVLDQILAKTDGVPLFVEELTKTLLESGLLTDAGTHYALAGRLAPLSIPSSLHDSLMARLDRLAPVREVAQIGAVIGRKFEHELLAAVSPLPENELCEALDQLVASELVFRSGNPPQAIYTFKHALVQDAAYQSLLKVKRQQLHGRVAAILDAQSSTMRDRQPEVLAYHFSEAGLTSNAVPYFLAAGNRAAQNNALREAENHFQQGIEKLQELPTNLDRDRLELSFRMSLASVIIATRGPQSKDTLQAHDVVRDIAERIEDPESSCFALHGTWQLYSTGPASHRRAADVARKILSIAEKQHDNHVNRIVGLRYLASSLFFLGSLKEATNEYQNAIGLLTKHHLDDKAMIHSFDISATVRSIYSVEQWVAGYPDKSECIAADALQRAMDIKHLHTEAFVLHYACNVLLTLRRDYRSACAFAQRSIELSSNQAFPNWLALAKILHGAALVLSGTSRSGCASALEGLRDLDEVGWRLFRPFLLAVAAAAQLEGGEVETAKTCLLEAHECSKVSDERWAEAEVWRVEAEVMASEAMLEKAEERYWRALEIARHQGAKSWELRAATSLARLWRDQGRPAEAREVLAPVYDWFTEGFDTADLRDAKALLEELA